MDFEEDGSFGDLLARYRTQARKSQQQLATCLGVHRSTIVKWEQKGSLPKDRTRVEEIAGCLKLTDQRRDALLKAALFVLSSLIWTIPFPRNPFFTGRDQELERLHTQLHHKQMAAVGQAQSISGLGGIGKTQLAVEYAYRYHDEYQYILWARAESVDALTSSYAEIAERLDLPEKDAREQEIVIEAVKRWLRRQRGWLLILDNADSPDLLPAFLPQTVGGHLLITTRAADLSEQIAGLAHSLGMDTFSEEQGALFLLHRSDQLALDATLDQAETPIRQLAMRLSQALGGLPLALDQVGAYLKATGSSLAAYQQIYQQHRAQLLNERRGAEHPEPVATTWDISFRKVEQQHPAAADLLRFCAFLAPDAIPEEILTEGVEGLGSILAPVAADPFLLNEAIESLLAYSLLARDPQARTLTIHRLVQAVLRDNMPVEMQQQWMQRAISAVEATYSGSDFSNGTAYERLAPHVAKPLLQRVLRIQEQQLGPNNPVVARTLSWLANLYLEQGDVKQAKHFFQRALAIYTEVYDSEHGLTRRTQERYDSLR